MNSWKVILATVVIFGAGVVTGGLLVNYVQHRHPLLHRNGGEARHEAGQELPLPRAEMMNKQFIQQLDDALNLSADQRRAIEKSRADGQQRNHELWKLVSPQMRMVIQDVNQRIRAKLTPEQQKKFAKLMKQLRPQRKSSAPNAAPAKLSGLNDSEAISTNLPAETDVNPPAR